MDGNEKMHFDMEMVRKNLEKRYQYNTETELINEFNNKNNYILSGISGFDKLFEKGIPAGSNILIVGGAGSGKTIFCLQMLIFHASQGKKCFYMSFEESENNLINHMKKFGWNPEEYIENGNLIIQRYSPEDIHYLAEKADMEKIFPNDDVKLTEIETATMKDGSHPDIIIIDSLSAISSAFVDKGSSYRFYAERLFRYFEKIKSTNFFTSETLMIPEIYTKQGVEEFLADGIIVLYNIRRQSVRERAIEVLKMRDAKHDMRIVAMKITDNGIVVFPNQEIFEDIKN